MTSHDVVYHVSRRFGRSLKVGHLGTLDPPAAGVLPLALGWATRLISHLPPAEKVYLAEIRFGVTSETLDAASELQPVGAPPPDLQERLQPLLERFRGVIMQTPPRVSALRQGGQRSYDRARRGEEFELPPRAATYHEVRWVRQTVPDRVWLRVACGPGTYVRSLARDLGEELGCGAVLNFLLRLQSGPFQLPEAVRIEELEPEALLDWTWPFRELPHQALTQWPPAPLEPAFTGLGHHAKGVALYSQGQKVWAREGVEWRGGA